MKRYMPHLVIIDETNKIEPKDIAHLLKEALEKRGLTVLSVNVNSIPAPPDPEDTYLIQTGVLVGETWEPLPVIQEGPLPIPKKLGLDVG